MYALLICLVHCVMQKALQSGHSSVCWWYDVGGNRGWLPKTPFSWRNSHTILSSSRRESTGTVTGKWSSALSAAAPPQAQELSFTSWLGQVHQALASSVLSEEASSGRARGVQFLSLLQLQRSVWEGGSFRSIRKEKLLLWWEGIWFPHYNIPGDLWESVYLASSIAALKMAEFCMKTCSRFLIPYALYCIKIQHVLLKQDV